MLLSWNPRKKARIKYLLLFVSLALLFYVHKQNVSSSDITGEPRPPVIPVPHHLSLVTSSSAPSSPAPFHAPAHDLKLDHLLDSPADQERRRLSQRIRSKLRQELLLWQQQNRTVTAQVISATAEHRRHRPVDDNSRYNSIIGDSSSDAVPGMPSIPEAGEMGKPVILEKEKMSPEVQQLIDKGWEDNAFNQFVSDMISVSRSLPDVRDPRSVFVPLPNSLTACLREKSSPDPWSGVRDVGSCGSCQSIGSSSPSLRYRSSLVICLFSGFRIPGKRRICCSLLSHRQSLVLVIACSCVRE